MNGNQPRNFPSLISMATEINNNYLKSFQAGKINFIGSRSKQERLQTEVDVLVKWDILEKAGIDETLVVQIVKKFAVKTEGEIESELTLKETAEFIEENCCAQFNSGEIKYHGDPENWKKISQMIIDGDKTDDVNNVKRIFSSQDEW